MGARGGAASGAVTMGAHQVGGGERQEVGVLGGAPEGHLAHVLRDGRRKGQPRQASHLVRGVGHLLGPAVAAGGGRVAQGG